MLNKIGEVVEFWCGEPENPEKMDRWWKKDDSLDQEIQNRFESLINDARSGALEEWKSSIDGQIGLLILLDQFSRNIYRGSSKAFDADPQAREISKNLIRSRDDKKLGPVKRWLVYLPLMHSEDIGDQELCIQKFEDFIEDFKGRDFESSAKNGLKYAIAHRDVIAKFGRFPHRNQALGRSSTSEEQEYLSSPGSGF